MDGYFVFLCVLIVIASLCVTILIGPILWDAAGYVEVRLNSVYSEGVSR